MAGGRGRVSGLRSFFSPGEGTMLSGESWHRAAELREEGVRLSREHRAPAVVSPHGFPFKLPPKPYDLSPDALL